MFREDQRFGEKMNDLTCKFFEKYPRAYGEEWPSKEHNEHDVVLRSKIEKIRGIDRPVHEKTKMVVEEAKSMGIAL